MAVIEKRVDGVGTQGGDSYIADVAEGFLVILLRLLFVLRENVFIF
jgi:hypothetical protein